MKISPVLRFVGAFAAFVSGAAHCMADPIWASGASLLEVIRYDLQAHDSGQQLTDFQTNAVCLLLGYFNGFAESSALAAHYNATALPFYLPDSITNDQIERVVYKYLADNPDKLDMKGGALVVAALTQAFPNPVFKAPAALAAPTAPAVLVAPKN
jgi:hypothetical protein